MEENALDLADHIFSPQRRMRDPERDGQDLNGDDAHVGVVVLEC